MSETESSEVAACCAVFYEQDWVQNLLGDSFHPGGPDLSARLVHSLNLPENARTLDVACGVGTTTLMMARQFGLDSVGLDFSQANIDSAIAAAGENPPVLSEFFQGSADSLPFEDSSFDAVVCECAVSTFPDQPKVIREFLRVVKPGGTIGITDMVIEGELPEDVKEHVAPWTCMAEAHSIAGYQKLFLDEGFVIAHYADESHTLLELISSLKKKLLLAGMGKALGALPKLPLELSDIRRLLKIAKELTNDGTVQYCRMVFSNGIPTHSVPPATEAPAANLCGCDDESCC